MAGENIDFVTQYLANNRIFGDDLVDISCKVYLPVNTQVKKYCHLTYLTHVLIMSMDL